MDRRPFAFLLFCAALVQAQDWSPPKFDRKAAGADPAAPAAVAAKPPSAFDAAVEKLSWGLGQAREFVRWELGPDAKHDPAVAAKFYEKLSRAQAEKAKSAPANKGYHLAAAYGAEALKHLSVGVGQAADSAALDHALPSYDAASPTALVGNLAEDILRQAGSKDPHAYLSGEKRRALLDPIWSESVDFAKNKDGAVDYARALSHAHYKMTGSRSDGPDDYAPDEAYVEHFLTAAEQGYRYGLSQSAAASGVWEAFSNTKKAATGHWYGVEPGAKGIASQLSADMMGMAWGASLPPPTFRKDGVADILFLGTYSDFQSRVGAEFGQWNVLHNQSDAARAKSCTDPDNHDLCVRKGWIEP